MLAAMSASVMWVLTTSTVDAAARTVRTVWTRLPLRWKRTPAVSSGGAISAGSPPMTLTS